MFLFNFIYCFKKSLFYYICRYFISFIINADVGILSGENKYSILKDFKDMNMYISSYLFIDNLVCL